MKNKIVEIIITRLERNSTYISSVKREKIKYILSVIVGEFEKIIVLLMVFSLIGKCDKYLLSLFTVSVTRTFAGGPHEKNSMRCYLHTILFFTVTIILSECDIVNIVMPVVVIICIITYWSFAPIVHEKRGNCSDVKRKKLKCYSVVKSK